MVQFFGAQFLVVKIKQNFSDLEQRRFQAFETRLQEVLWRLASKGHDIPTPTVRQLCVAWASLFIQGTPHFSNQMLPDLCQRWCPVAQQSSAGAMIFLEILIILPEVGCQLSSPSHFLVGLSCTDYRDWGLGNINSRYSRGYRPANCNSPHFGRLQTDGVEPAI